MINKLIFFIGVLLLPIVCTADMHQQVPETFDNGTSTQWQKIGQMLVDTKETTIYLYWAGFGGDTRYMSSFMTQMKIAETQGKNIIIILVGDAYSAHALSACAATEIRGMEQHFLMYHMVADYSGNVLSGPAEVEYFRGIARDCVYKNILSTSDLDKIFSGFEVYVYKNNGSYVKYYKPDRRLK